MGAHFHAELGPFFVDVQLDDFGIPMLRGPLSQAIRWEEISGATLIRTAHRDESENKRDEQRAAQFLGPDAAQKIHELRDKVGEIIVAYRDGNGHASETEVPAPLIDAAFVQEFETRLAIDRQHATKRLHTNPGYFTSILVLVALLGIIAVVVAAVALFGLLGPVLNFLSIQKMLLDLQDGNYASFIPHLGSYLALFAVGYLLRRVIRAKLDTQRETWFAPRDATLADRDTHCLHMVDGARPLSDRSTRILH